MMKTTLRLGLLAFCCGFASLAIAQKSHLSPAASTMLRKLNKENKTSYGIIQKDGQDYINAFISLKDGAAQQDLRGYGFLPGSQSGNVLTGLVPVAKLAALAADPHIAYIQAGEMVRQHNDKTRQETKVTLVHNGTGLPRSFYGKDVVVGIIDDGFEYGHPTFYDTSGTIYRVKRVWEQGANGTPPAGYAYGREFKTKNAILSRQKDNITNSHGLHVAGTAAGSGYGADDDRYMGMAPAADIVLVSFKLAEGEAYLAGPAANIADGISYIMHYADSVGKPCVINMSLGTSYGPHDGTSLFDQFCDGKAGAGKILVGSAGNSGAEQIHLRKDFTGLDTLHTLIGFPNETIPTAGQFIVDVWGEPGEDIQTSVSIYNTTTQTYEAATEFVSVSSGYEQDTTIFDADTDAGGAEGIQISGGGEVNPLNNRPHMVLLIDGTAQEDLDQWIKITATSTGGTVYMWADDYPQKAYFTDLNLGAPFSRGDAESSIGEIGGTGKNIITVGAYTLNNKYLDINGDSTDAPIPGTIGDIASFSSHGPTIDGRTKPDITAPGNVVASSVSSWDDTHYPDGSTSLTDEVNFNGDNYLYGTMQGTSMSSPAVAGIVALWLEANPSLTPAQVLALMKQTARTDNFTGTIPAAGSNTWGWGKIDAYAPLGQLTNIQSMSGKTSLMVYPNPSRGVVYTLFPQSANNVALTVCDVTGKVVYKAAMGRAGKDEVTTIPLPELPEGTYLLHYAVDGEVLTDKVVIAE